MNRTLIACALVLSACNSDRKAATPAPAPVAAPTPAPAAAPAPHPDTCEVEMVGQLVLPDKLPPNPHLAVYVVDGDCAADGAKPVARWEATLKGVFTGEVYTRWGADLTVCAAIEEKPGAPTTMWGKADGVFHAEKTGEVVFTDFKVPLSPRPRHTFAPPLPPLPH